MPFGEIFTGTFAQIWQHKRLWLFGLLGLALTSVGLGIYQLFQFRWQSQWVDLMGGVSANPMVMPQRFFGEMLSAMTWLWVGWGLWMLVSLLGYLINLVMRGATIHEADVAWAGGRTDTGRGIAAGAGRAIYVFLLDLLWLLPGILLGCGGVGALIAAFAAVGSLDQTGGGVGVFVLSLFGALCCVFCLALLVGVLSAVFAPLMYQSAVAGRRGLGAAIGEGWRLAQVNLGAMIIYALLLWVLSIALMILVSILSLPFALPWLSGWMRDWAGMMDAASSGLTPTMPQVHNGWLVVAALASGLLTWLSTSFLQSFGLTLYARVYRHLSGQETSSAPQPSDSAAEALPTPPPDPVAPVALSEEITVPDDVTESAETPVSVPDPYV